MVHQLPVEVIGNVPSEFKKLRQIVVGSLFVENQAILGFLTHELALFDHFVVAVEVAKHVMALHFCQIEEVDATKQVSAGLWKIDFHDPNV